MAEPVYLLDTNICIYMLGGGAPAVRERAERCEPGQLATSSVAFANVMIGARTLRATAEARAFFEVVTVLAFGEEAGLAYATLPFRRGSFDRLIAAHALALGLVLVTNDESGFADVPGLKLENWTCA